MKISVIDIGSNSVRLMLMADGKTLYKRLKTTRLGEGLTKSRKLLFSAMERSAEAISEYVSLSASEGFGKPYAFATAAVRSAENGYRFVEMVKSVCGVDVEILSGEEEASCSLAGALRGKDGGIIDLGGASTEITVQEGGRVIYSKSVDIGTVRLFDTAGQDKQRLSDVIDKKIEEYGCPQLSGADMYGVGGTATSLAALKLGLSEYDPALVDGTVLTAEWLFNEADILLAMTVKQRKELRGMDVRRADVIAGGCLLMYKILAKSGINKITVSESDNLEGYAILKGLAK